jgi:hypothetical protein
VVREPLKFPGYNVAELERLNLGVDFSGWVQTERLRVLVEVPAFGAEIIAKQSDCVGIYPVRRVADRLSSPLGKTEKQVAECLLRIHSVRSAGPFGYRRFEELGKFMGESVVVHSFATRGVISQIPHIVLDALAWTLSIH